jgi:hypothetical protein
MIGAASFALPTSALAAVLPVVVTQSVTPTAATTATVRGVVNPEGQTTTYKAVYALATSVWCMTNGTSGSPTNSTTFHTVSIGVTGLTAGASYCAAISATNASGTSTTFLIAFGA